MGMNKRIENLERHMGSPQPVVVVVKEAGPPGREREEAAELFRVIYDTPGAPPRRVPPKREHTEGHES